MSGPSYRVKDEGDLRKYYTQIPNLIDDMDLSVYAFRLYAHLKRVAGESGTCYQSTKTLVDACKMSAGSIANAKDELAEKKLIRIRTQKGEHGEFSYHEITIVDIWSENIAKYSTCSPDEQDRSPSEQDRSPDDTVPSYDVNRTVSPHETKNNPIKNNPLKNNEEESRPSNGQIYFLHALNKKHLNAIQRQALVELETQFGLETLKAGIDWCALNDMNAGRAIASLKKALPNWGQPKIPKNGNGRTRAHPTEDAFDIIQRRRERIENGDET